MENIAHTHHITCFWNLEDLDQKRWK